MAEVCANTGIGIPECCCLACLTKLHNANAPKKVVPLNPNAQLKSP